MGFNGDAPACADPTRVERGKYVECWLVPRIERSGYMSLSGFLCFGSIVSMADEEEPALNPFGKAVADLFHERPSYRAISSYDESISFKV
ncbi:hypothetical protein M407DRAFT_157958 [Tulasnella calospora MUT 4182]|uniref:Uncharacterized protein n=1 Tax=Tulasnella calospora MUT 4182 TaxID=1051891 RepID=A0A0C3LAM9_9AGAM|nr:hypothetical protein M407DRAFT_157958 [Tulasnella calospora MUT 4182]